MPYLKNDLWGGHFRDVGLNPLLNSAWLNRGKDKKQWIGALYSTFGKPYEKVVCEYEKHGILSDRKRFHTIQLDAEHLDEMLCDSVFRESFLSTLYKAREEKIVVNVFINQYAGINKGDEYLAYSRFEKLKQNVLSFFYEYGLNDNNEDVIIETIPERDKTFWCDYIDKIAEIGGNAFRFSCEWSRVMNSEGIVNEEEFDDLAEIIEYAKSKNIDVTLCLNHFTMPDWIQGGWLNPDIVKLFGDYSELVFNELEKRDALPKRFLSINEAMSIIPAGYLEGAWPPYEKLTPANFIQQISRYIKAVGNTRKAHVEAYSRIKKNGRSKGKDIQVGFTHNMAWFSPYMKFSPLDYIWSAVGANLSESWIKEALEKDWEAFGNMPTDFVGLQFYNEHTFGPFNGSLGTTTSLRDLIDSASRFINGWKRYPEGMLIQLIRVNSMILKTANRYGLVKLPGIMISEFGVPGVVDPVDELKVLSDAVNIASSLSNLEYVGATIWTLKNNLELSEGFFVNFGYYDHNGNGKERSSVEVSGLNLKDPNIRIALEEYRHELKAYAKRLKRDNKVEIQEKFGQQQVADQKLEAIDRFLVSLKN
ncbi:glycoside hydrolase family 1 protein [Candidatus Dojkabacteria bacterium]|nr:glycoside hydrolase family 1 protein [Candidatus Dojkabacteria bacterium]